MSIVLDDAKIDPEVPGFFNRPDYFELLATLRAEAPVYQYRPGAWVITAYEDIRSISRDPGTFCSSKGVLMNDPVSQGMELRGSVLHMDPPEHAKWRRPVSSNFTPKGVALLEPAVREVVCRILDEVPLGETIDFVENVSAPIPTLAIAELLGIGDADRSDFRKWSDAVIGDADNPGSNPEDLGALMGFLGDHAKAKSASPGDDIMSALTQLEIDGERLTQDELIIYTLSLLVAGNETTRHLLSGSFAAFAENPDQRARIVQGPEIMATAVEECLRWVTPIQAFGRTATKNTQIAGVDIAQGDFVAMLYLSGNRDESAFGPTANNFDVTRGIVPPHLAFGFGEHLCLGAALARMEARIVFEESMARFKGYELAGDPVWVESTIVRGMRSLPITFR